MPAESSLSHYFCQGPRLLEELKTAVWKHFLVRPERSCLLSWGKCDAHFSFLLNVSFVIYLCIVIYWCNTQMLRFFVCVLELVVKNNLVVSDTSK